MIEFKKLTSTTLKNRFGHFRAGWRIFFYLIFVIVLFNLSDLLAGSLSLQGNNLSDYSLLLNRLVNKSFKLLAVFIPAIVLLKWVDKRPRELLGLGYFKENSKAFAVGMLMGAFMGTLAATILWLSGVATFSFNGLSLDLILYLLCVLVILAISASFEELLFRGYIFQSLIEGSNFWIALGVFSLLFGAGHIDNPEITIWGVAFTVVAGIFLGLLYFKTRTLWICIGVHFMWNWIMALSGIGIDASPFLKRSLFSYTPVGAGAETMSEIIQSSIMLGLAIFIWKSSWFEVTPAIKKLWAMYPQRYDTAPDAIQ